MSAQGTKSNSKRSTKRSENEAVINYDDKERVPAAAAAVAAETEATNNVAKKTKRQSSTTATFDIFTRSENATEVRIVSKEIRQIPLGSISATSTNQRGNEDIKRKACSHSVLIHPIGPLLMAFLYHQDRNGKDPLSTDDETPLEKMGKYFLPHFDRDDVLDQTKRSKYNDVLKNAFNAALVDASSTNEEKKKAAKGEGLVTQVEEEEKIAALNDTGSAIEEEKKQQTIKEKTFTSELYKKLYKLINGKEPPAVKSTMNAKEVAALKGCSQLQVRNEEFISSNADSSKGYTDLLFHCGLSAVAIFEFGLNNNLWWSKHGQNTRYAEVLLKNQKDFHFNKPILLVTVTIDPNDKNGSAQFGIFLCINKMGDTDNFRAALLWRTETNSIDDASHVFGKIVYATELCAKWREWKYDNYRYLGPNCARLGTKLLRCYDTRHHPTIRNPEYYIKEKDATTELHLKDSDSPADFGFTYPLSEEFKLGWMWSFAGQVLIISTTFIEGVHYARSPKDFIPIVKHLLKMHKSGFVHGDIRAFNMVFNTIPSKQVVGGTTTADCCVTASSEFHETSNSTADTESESVHTGYLIDFDLSGKEGKTFYPEGYVFDLPDGDRRGVVGGAISYNDDWYALVHIIFKLHKIVYPAGFRGSVDYDKLSSKEKDCSFAVEPEEFSVDKAAACFLDFLKFAVDKDCKMAPADKFMTRLKYYKMLSNNCNDQNDRSDNATGTPGRQINNPKVIMQPVPQVSESLPLYE